MCVCTDQQDGDGEGDSDHHLHVLLHQLDDLGGARLQDETKTSSYCTSHGSMFWSICAISDNVHGHYTTRLNVKRWIINLQQVSSLCRLVAPMAACKEGHRSKTWLHLKPWKKSGTSHALVLWSHRGVDSGGLAVWFSGVTAAGVGNLRPVWRSIHETATLQLEGRKYSNTPVRLLPHWIINSVFQSFLKQKYQIFSGSSFSVVRIYYFSLSKLSIFGVYDKIMN